MGLRTLWRTIAIGGLTAVGVAGCASTPDLSAGNPLPGIGLGASGNSVLLSWDPESPIAQDLRPNTNLQLVASYESPNGTVRGEPVSNYRVGALYSTAKFDLPESLNNIATGPVCFQIVQNRRPIPVRIARPGESSAGFYYDEWVNVANLGRELRVLRNDKINIDQNVENFAAGDPDFLRWRTDAGLTDIAQCDQLVAETENVRPTNALRGAEKVTAAKRQCVALMHDVLDLKLGDDVQTLRELRPSLTPMALAREIQSGIPAAHRSANFAREMMSDMNNYATGQHYFEVAALPINQATKISLWVVNKGNPTEANAISLAEAYSGCISETEGRIDQAYEAWQDRNDPNFKRQLTEARRAECRTRFESFAAREQRLEIWQARQAETNQKIVQLENAGMSALPNEKPLIPEACPYS